MRGVAWMALLLVSLGVAALPSPERAEATSFSEEWTKTFNGSASGDDRGEDIAVDASGNVYVAGSTFNGQNQDIWVRKYSPSGAILGTEIHNPVDNANDEAFGIAVDNSGSAYVVGYITRTSLGLGRNIWIRKYDANTVPWADLWTREVDGAGSDPVSAGSTDVANDVALDSAGNVYVIGVEYMDSPEFQNIWVGKYSSAGDIIWTKSFSTPTSGNNSDDEGYGITASPDGYIYATGFEENTDFGQAGQPWDDIWVAKLSQADGSPVWIKRYDSPDHDHDKGYGIAADSYGNVYVVGSSRRSEGEVFSYSAVTLRYDSAGVLKWVSVFDLSSGRAEAAESVIVDLHRQVFVVGHRDKTVSLSDNVWIRERRPDSTLIKDLVYDSPDGLQDVGYSIAVDAQGNLYAAGFETRTAQAQDIWVRTYAVPTCADTDGDGLDDCKEARIGTFLLDPDTDDDGCLDPTELSANPLAGGARNPLDPYDYYDINHDGAINVIVDILGVAGGFGPSSGPRYIDHKDRGPLGGPNKWNHTAPDWYISTTVDILGVAAQFGHPCPHPHGPNTPFGAHPAALTATIGDTQTAPFPAAVGSTAGFAKSGQILVDDANAETLTYNQNSGACPGFNSVTEFCITARGAAVQHGTGIIVYQKP